MVFLGRMIRDLDDIEDFKKWLQTKDARAARLEKEKKEKLERALIEPKHMMDASDHYKGNITSRSPNHNSLHCPTSRSVHSIHRSIHTDGHMICQYLQVHIYTWSGFKCLS